MEVGAVERQPYLQEGQEGVEGWSRGQLSREPGLRAAAVAGLCTLNGTRYTLHQNAIGIGGLDAGTSSAAGRTVPSHSS